MITQASVEQLIQAAPQLLQRLEHAKEHLAADRRQSYLNDARKARYVRLAVTYLIQL